MSSSQPGYSLELPGKFKIPMARPHLKPIKSESPKGKGAWVRVFVKVSQLFFMCTKCGDPLLYLCIVLSLSLFLSHRWNLKTKTKTVSSSQHVTDSTPVTETQVQSEYFKCPKRTERVAITDFQEEFASLFLKLD